MDKKTQQLGMNFSTASNRMVKDTLFKLAVAAGYKCHRCGGELIRESFSVEHKVPWLDSANPKELFFDQQNIAFSHLHCNVGAGRKQPPIYTKEEAKQRDAARKRRDYTPESRRDKYERTGY